MRGLAEFVAKHDLKQRELAEAADISTQAVSYILAGERTPSKDTIDALLAFCRTIDPKVTYDRLFGEVA
jgi:transcriptional regulator with XRE-family HTH domain